MEAGARDKFGASIAEVSAEEWRGIARGLQAHLLQTGRHQKDLAAAAGLASSNLSTYLNLRRTPSPTMIRRILRAALEDQGVTLAMISHWKRQLDETELRLQERLAELINGGLALTAGQRDHLLAAVAGDRTLAQCFQRLTDEVRTLRSRCSQFAMAHTDAARESLVQSAVEEFLLDPRMRHLTREVEKDIRKVHGEERKQHPGAVQALEAILERHQVRIERVAPATPRTGRGRWEGIRWLLSLKDARRATVSTQIHPDQYPFELGRVVGQLRLMRLLGSEAQREVEGFASAWVEENFPQVITDPPERSQLEQDIVWLIFRSLAGRWATGFFTLPSDRFVRLAEQHQYDVDRLSADLQVSWETVANRISQLDSGLPVHFVKMDWRGVVLKRSSFSGLQFAPLYMRVCGRWASARSLLTSPGSIFRQYSTFPDLAGQTFFCVSRSVRAPVLRYGAAPLVYSLTLGVRASDAHRMVYAENFNSPAVECGVTCRLCTVLNCENRVCPAVSHPGMGKFDFSLVWSGKTIHERFPSQR
jgi:predicted transcriptional regulator